MQAWHGKLPLAWLAPSATQGSPRHPCRPHPPAAPWPALLSAVAAHWLQKWWQHRLTTGSSGGSPHTTHSPMRCGDSASARRARTSGASLRAAASCTQGVARGGAAQTCERGWRTAGRRPMAVQLSASCSAACCACGPARSTPAPGARTHLCGRYGVRRVHAPTLDQQGVVAGLAHAQQLPQHSHIVLARAAALGADALQARWRAGGEGRPAEHEGCRREAGSWGAAGLDSGFQGGTRQGAS